MRDREGEYFPVEILLTLHESEKLDNTSHCESHAMGVLSVCNVEGSGAALHLACQQWEIHIPRSHEEGGICKLTNERLKLFQLIVGKGLLPESHGIVGLRTRLSHWNRVIPTFVDTFNQNSARARRYPRMSNSG